MSDEDVPTQSDSLLADPGVGNNENAPESSAAWMLDDGVQGTGETPEWFKRDKYKSVADQARAYTELEKQFGGVPKAPEEYRLTMPEGLEGEFNPDDPLLSGFMDIARRANLTQNTFDAITQHYVTHLSDGIQHTREQEKATLGTGADSRLRDLADWGNAHLTADEYEVLQEMGQTARGVLLAEKLIGMTREVPTASEAAASSPGEQPEARLQELQFAEDVHGNRKMSVDPEYRKRVDEEFARIYGGG